MKLTDFIDPNKFVVANDVGANNKICIPEGM